MRPEMNPKSPTTVKDFFTVFTIIYFALLAGILVFATIVIAITPNWALSLSEEDNPFLLIAPVLAVVAFFMSGFLFKQFLTKAQKESSLSNKLKAYVTASIVKFAVIEAAALFAIVSALLTSNLFFIVILVLLILYFLTQKPTLEKTEKDLMLKDGLKKEMSI